MCDPHHIELILTQQLRMHLRKETSKEDTNRDDHLIIFFTTLQKNSIEGMKQTRKRTSMTMNEALLCTLSLSTTQDSERILDQKSIFVGKTANDIQSFFLKFPKHTFVESLQFCFWKWHHECAWINKLNRMLQRSFWRLTLFICFKNDGHLFLF